MCVCVCIRDYLSESKIISHLPMIANCDICWLDLEQMLQSATAIWWWSSCSCLPSQFRSSESSQRFYSSRFASCATNKPQMSSIDRRTRSTHFSSLLPVLGNGIFPILWIIFISCLLSLFCLLLPICMLEIIKLKVAANQQVSRVCFVCHCIVTQNSEAGNWMQFDNEQTD